MRALLSACAPLAALAVTVQDNPVKKVVGLLNDMHNAMETEQKEDAKLHAKMECWCNSNRKAKTDAVEAAQKAIKRLNGVIAENAGVIGKSNAQIKHDTEHIAKKQQELAEAAALRKKESDAADALQSEQKDTIDALERAIKALSKANSFSQKDVPTLLQVAKAAGGYSESLQRDLFDVLGSIQDKPRPGFLQSDFDERDKGIDYANKESQYYEPGKYEKTPVAPGGAAGAVAGAKSYNSQSGGIFGLLKQMNDDFHRDLNASIESEAQADAQFEKMRTALNQEIAALKQSKQDAEKALGDAKMAKSNAQTEKKNTTAELGADEKFLVDMEADCKEAAASHMARSTERGNEIEAVGKAIEILTSDEARDQFNKSISFVQVSNEKSVRQHVSASLMAVAKRTGNAELAQVAVSAKLAAFTKVKEALDKLHTELAAEQKLEAKQREECRNNFNENKVSTVDSDTKASDTQATIDDMAAAQEKLTGEIKILNAEIDASRVSMQQAAADRSEESHAFQVTMKDQQLTIRILNQALGALESFYGKNALIQKAGEAVSERPEKAAAYGRNQAAPGAMGLIQNIIADANQVMKQATADEQAAQAHYENMVVDSNESISNMQKAVTQKTGENAQAGIDKEEAEATLAELTENLKNLAQEKADLHTSCDFLLKNFEVRQDAREQEMESIQQAKAVLSGASFQ